jgi:hypothetical protein
MPEQPVAVEPDRAKDLMRLGWAIAELRGRLGFGSRDPGRLIQAEPVRTDHALPLGEERTPDELLTEVKGVVAALATRTALTFKGDDMKDAEGNLPTKGSCTGAQRVIELADAVPEDLGAATRTATWDAFTEALYQWDASIQNQLASATFGESSAYQLGRGLAESSWMLDPATDPNSISGWEHLFSAERCVALTRLLERLDPALPNLSVQATKGSLAAWRNLARDPAWRSLPLSPAYLRQQILIWRDLLVVGTDPQSLDKPSMLQRISTIVPVLKALWLQLVLIVCFTVALALGAWLLTKYGHSGPSGEIVSGIGILGITTTSLSAKAKATGNSLVARLNTAVDADLVVAAATVVPPKPKDAKVSGPGMLSMPGSVAEPVTMLQVVTPPTPMG